MCITCFFQLCISTLSSVLSITSRESMDKRTKYHCHANCTSECISCQITEQGRLIRECRHCREVPCPQTLHKHLIQRRGNGTAPHAEGPRVWYNTWECTITPRWEQLFSLPLRFVFLPPGFLFILILPIGFRLHQRFVFFGGGGGGGDRVDYCQSRILNSQAAPRLQSKARLEAVDGVRAVPSVSKARQTVEADSCLES